MAGNIFINYRRDDSSGTAGRLYDRLVQTFGRERLFMDVDHIPAGVDFVTYLNTQVGTCDIFLAIIGPNWLNAKDRYGGRRIDNPDDFVLVEIATALARNIRVIPVLVDGALIPTAGELPKSIKPLVRRNATEVRNAHFGRDAEALVDEVREVLQSPRKRSRFLASAAAFLRVPGRWRVAGRGAIFLAGWIGLYQIGVLTLSAEQPADDQAGQPQLKEEQEHKASVAADIEAKLKAAEAEQQRLKEEVQRQTKAAADAEEKRKDAEAEQQRLAAADAERKAEAAARARAEQTEKERLAAANAEEERRAKAAAEAEARRKAEEAERERQAALREEERRKQAEVERLVQQSYMEWEDGDYNRAIATANRAMQLDPKNALAFNHRGLAYMDKGDNDRAIADFNEAIRLNHNLARAFNNRGDAYARKGNSKQAIADYNEAVQLKPDYALAFCNRGRLKLRLNQASGREDLAKARQRGGASSCR